MYHKDWIYNKKYVISDSNLRVGKKNKYNNELGDVWANL